MRDAESLNVEPNATSEWVVDASVVAKWYLRDEEFVAQADRLLDRYLDGTMTLTTPHFTRYELANAVTRAAREGRLTEQEASAAVVEFSGLGLAQDMDNDELLFSSLQIAARFSISFYDALYLAVAEERGLRVVTADIAFYDRVVEDVPYVSLIGDIPA